MRLIYFPGKEAEKIKEILKEKDRFHSVISSSEHGKYKKGEYVKTAWGERLIVIDSIFIKDFEHFKKEYIHYPELKNMNMEEIKKAFTHKKVEIIELKRYRFNKSNLS